MSPPLGLGQMLDDRPGRGRCRGDRRRRRARSGRRNGRSVPPSCPARGRRWSQRPPGRPDARRARSAMPDGVTARALSTQVVDDLLDAAAAVERAGPAEGVDVDAHAALLGERLPRPDPSRTTALTSTGSIGPVSPSARASASRPSMTCCNRSVSALAASSRSRAPVGVGGQAGRRPVRGAGAARSAACAAGARRRRRTPLAVDEPLGALGHPVVTPAARSRTSAGRSSSTPGRSGRRRRTARWRRAARAAVWVTVAETMSATSAAMPHGGDGDAGTASAPGRRPGRR